MKIKTSCALPKSFARRAALLLAISLCGASHVSGATVRGLLQHMNGARAVGFAVRVNSQILGPSGFSFSGNDGMYYLNNIPSGFYVLEVWINNQNVLRYSLFVQEPYTDFPPVAVP